MDIHSDKIHESLKIFLLKWYCKFKFGYYRVLFGQILKNKIGDMKENKKFAIWSNHQEGLKIKN